MPLLEKRKKLIIVSVIAVLIFFCMGLSTLAFDRAFIVRDIVTTITSPVQKAVTVLVNGIDGFFNFVFEMKDYKAENDRLTARIAELERKYRSAEDYRKENERLSKLLDLKQNELSFHNSTSARVIGWSADNWFDHYTIDKGSIDGVKKKNMVLAAEGLVGQIDEVGLNWSRVITIIDPVSSVGARVVRTGDVGMVEGDLALEKHGLCKMTLFNKDAPIVVGDIVETSGLGDVYAPGLAIGRITEIRSDATGISYYAIIKPLVDFKSLHHVLLVLD